MIATIDVVSESCHQSLMLRGVTLNISPPKVTISICPAIIMSPIHKNPVQFHIELKVSCPEANDLALNMFQNCSITNIVKNSDNS